MNDKILFFYYFVFYINVRAIKHKLKSCCASQNLNFVEDCAYTINFGVGVYYYYIYL